MWRWPKEWNGKRLLLVLNNEKRGFEWLEVWFCGRGDMGL
jgi:hypothetical protein